MVKKRKKMCEKNLESEKYQFTFELSKVKTTWSGVVCERHRRISVKN